VAAAQVASILETAQQAELPALEVTVQLAVGLELTIMVAILADTVVTVLLEM
jgi:hypothetical protein